MKDIKDITCLVIDNGMYISVAQKAAEYYKKVYYYTDIDPEYDKIKNTATGYGLPDVERVEDDEMYEVAKDVDLIIIPDTKWYGLAEHFRELGYNVWNGGNMERLETDRFFLKIILKDLGLPVNPYTKVVGIDKLREFIKKEKEVYVKINYRGDSETDHFEGYKTSEQALNKFEWDVGAMSKVYPFLTEQPVLAVAEVGIDTICIDGKYPEDVLVGLELKDKMYCGIVKKYIDLPYTITECLEALSPMFKTEQYRQWISTECRVVEDRTSYLTDFTARLPLPPGDVELELIKNWGEIWWYGSKGMLRQPVYEAKYAMQIFISSSLSSCGDVAIEIPEGEERWFKFRNLALIDGTYYVLSHNSKMNEIGSIIAIGDDIDELPKQLIKRAEIIKGYGLSVDTDNLEKGLAEFKEALKKKII